MKIKEMTINDIEKVVPFYISYYNEKEESCWTAETAKKRITQVITMMDAYSLVLLDDNDDEVGFVMGFFKQYDDLISYMLEEIVISTKYQGKGLGKKLIDELEFRIKEKGALGIELQAVNDEMHEHFYSKCGFKTSNSFVGKCKWYF